jgi:hypothetical protein
MAFNLEDILSRTQDRETGFRFMVDYLKTLKNPLIIETGCARGNTPEGDGWSTMIWDKFITEYSGSAYSVDNNSAHVEFAKSQVENLEVVLGDSVKFLHDMSNKNLKIDLLYLDSYDFIAGEEHNSSLHHIFELGCIMQNLNPGALVVVDDCMFKDGVRDGKGVYVHKLMENLGKDLVHDGYQMIWKW